MALINCPECGHEVSTTAEKCPNCGFSIAQFLENQEKAKEDEKRKIEEAKRQKELDQIKLAKEEKKKKLFHKYFGTTKKKIICTSIIILIIAAIISAPIIYHKSTQDYHYELSNIDDAESKLSMTNKNISYAKTVTGDFKKDLYLEQMPESLKTANLYVILAIDGYNELSDKYKKMVDEYLDNTYNTTMQDLQNEAKGYGLKILQDDYASTNDDYYVSLAESYLSNTTDTSNAEQSVEVTSVSYTINEDSYKVTGSVKNTTDTTVYFVKVKICLEDSKGNVLNTDSTYAVGDEGLNSNESSTFTCFIDRVDGVDKVTASIYDYN